MNPQSAPRDSAPPLWASAAIGLGFWLLVWWLCARRLAALPELYALDFTYGWRAAGHLIAGRNPYEHMPPAPYAQGGLFLYPLTTAVLVAPLAKLPAAAAGSLFIGLSAGLLAFGLSRQGYWRLIAFLSPAWVLSYWNVQWAPIIVASALVPALGWVGVGKPNLGLIAFAYRPKWSTAIACAMLIAVSLLWLPTWPASWLATLRLQESPHTAPIFWPLGFVSLAALLRWRTPEGRLLIVASIIPAATQPYDHLPLWLVVRNWRESLILVLTSWAAWVTVLATAPHDLTRSPGFVQALLAVGMYWPATIMLLRRANVGRAPAWLDRVTKRWPAWLRGVPA